MAGKPVDPTVKGIYKATVLSWDQHHMTGKGKQPAQKNKISTVKPKGKEPTFQSQQQQPPYQPSQAGDANAAGKRKQTRHGKKKAKSQDHAHFASSAYIPFPLPAIKTTISAAIDLHLAAHQPLLLYQGHQGLPADTQIQQAFSLAERLEICPSCEMIQTLHMTITSSFSSDATFLCSPFYKAESANPYPLNDDRELANQLGVAYFGPSGFSFLPAEDLSELVAFTSASIVELDSNAGSSSLPAKCKRSHCSYKQVIMFAPADRWDSNNMVNIYGSDIEGEIAEAAGLNFIDMRQVISSTAPSQSGSHWSLLDVVSVSAQLYLDCVTPVDTNVSTYRDNGLSCLYFHKTDKCMCDHGKKLWILDSGASMHFIPDQSDFIKYQELTGSACIPVQTTSATIFVEGQGQVLVC